MATKLHNLRIHCRWALSGTGSKKKLKDTSLTLSSARDTFFFFPFSWYHQEKRQNESSLRAAHHLRGVLASGQLYRPIASGLTLRITSRQSRHRPSFLTVPVESLADCTEFLAKLFGSIEMAPWNSYGTFQRSHERCTTEPRRFGDYAFTRRIIVVSWKTKVHFYKFNHFKWNFLKFFNLNIFNRMI